MSDPIVFDRKPYTVSYRDQKSGEIKKIRRVPPPLIHDMLPTDLVELKTKRNDDWVEGGKYVVSHINSRHPNVLQIENKDGEKTFVSSLDLELKEKRSHKGDPRDNPRSNRYLLWP